MNYISYFKDAFLLREACHDLKSQVFYEEDAKRRANIAEKYAFSDIKYGLFYRIREFTAEEYVELLGTYSDHIAIDEEIRTLFFKDIENIINSFNGVIKIYDTMDLQLARKVK